MASRVFYSISVSLTIIMIKIAILVCCLAAVNAQKPQKVGSISLECNNLLCNFFKFKLSLSIIHYTYAQISLLVIFSQSHQSPLNC